MKELLIDKEIIKINNDCLIKIKKDVKKSYLYIGEKVGQIDIIVEKAHSANLVFLFLEDSYQNIKINGEVFGDANLEIVNFFVSKNINIKQEIKTKDVNAFACQKSVVITHEKAKQIIAYSFENNYKVTEVDQDVVVIGYQNSETAINCVGKIDKAASKSNNNQKLKGIIQDNAKIELDPVLLIDDYDVMASHSASLGNMSEEEIFYLQSRGILLEEAKKLIILGNIFPILELVQNKEVLIEIKTKMKF